MYIDTKQVNTEKEYGQHIFDSRIIEKDKKEVKTVLIDKDKIENVITLYKHNIMVICSICYAQNNKEIEIEGIPTEISGDSLYIIVNNEKKSIKLSSITDFKISTF